MFVPAPPPLSPAQDRWILIAGRSPDRLPPAVVPALTATGYKIIATASLYGAAALWVRHRAMLRALVVDVEGLSEAELAMLPTFHKRHAFPVVLLPGQAGSSRGRAVLAAGATTWESFAIRAPSAPSNKKPPSLSVVTGGPNKPSTHPIAFKAPPRPADKQVTLSPFVLYDELSRQPLLSEQELQALLEPPPRPG